MITDLFIAVAAIFLTCNVLGLAAIGVIEWGDPAKLLLIIKKPWFKTTLFCFFCGVWIIARTFTLKYPTFIATFLTFTAVFSLCSFTFGKLYTNRLRQSLQQKVDEAEIALKSLSNGPELIEPKLDEQLLRARMQLVEVKTQLHDKPCAEPYDFAAASKKAKKEAIWCAWSWVVIMAMYDTWTVHRPRIPFDLLFGSLTGLLVYGMSCIQILLKTRLARNSDETADATVSNKKA
jgi:hypothetical protein